MIYIYLISGEMAELKVKLVHEYATMPTRATSGSAGLDLYACEEGVIQVVDRQLIRTGVQVILPENTVGLIKSRSGLALDYELDVCAGVIDSDYRGEIKVLIMNNGPYEYKYKYGDKNRSAYYSTLSQNESGYLRKLR